MRKKVLNILKFQKKSSLIERYTPWVKKLRIMIYLSMKAIPNRIHYSPLKKNLKIKTAINDATENLEKDFMQRHQKYLLQVMFI